MGDLRDYFLRIEKKINKKGNILVFLSAQWVWKKYFFYLCENLLEQNVHNTL